MKICVCIKQVPSSDKLRMDEKEGTLMRSERNVCINPSDVEALELALRIKDKMKASITVITMGPQSAENVLRYGLAMGADDAYLLNDNAFSGSDVLATSFTLAETIKMLGGFDLVICGKRTLDGDTGLVPMALAAQLEYSFYADIKSISLNGVYLCMVQNNEDEILKFETPIPSVVTAAEDVLTPRIASLKSKLMSTRKKIQYLVLENMKVKDRIHYGLKGSPTRVVEIYIPKIKSKERIQTGTSRELADKIVSFIKK